MPKLPDPFGARATPRATGGVVDYGRADVSGVMDVAESIYRFSSEQVQKQDEFDYAQAKTGFLIEQSKILSELEADPDYETHEARYAEASQKALEGVSARLKPRDRDVFGMEMALQDQRGLLQVREQVRAKDRASVRAGVESSAIALREAYLSPSVGPDIRTQIPFALKQMVDGAVRRGAMAEDDAVVFLHKAGVDLVESRARMLLSQGKAEEADEYLKSAEAVAYLPADKRALLLEAKVEQDVFGQARTLADGILAQGGDRAAVNAAVANIGDARVRAQAQSFVDADLSRREAAKAEAESAEFETVATLLMNAAQSGEDVQGTLETRIKTHGPEWAALSAQSRAALQKMAAGDERVNDNALYAFIKETQWTKGNRAALQELQKNPGAFSQSTYQSMFKELSKEPESRDILTFDQRLKQYGSKLNDDERGALYIEAERRFREEEVALQLKDAAATLPTARKNEIVENLLVESAEWNSDRTLMLPSGQRETQFQLIDRLREKVKQGGQDATPEVLGQAVERAWDMADDVRKHYRKKGQQLTREQALRAWVVAGMPDEIEE